MTIEEIIASKTKTMTDLSGKKTKVLYLKDESEIEDFKQQLLIQRVSQQREMLLAMGRDVLENTHTGFQSSLEDLADSVIANNFKLIVGA